MASKARARRAINRRRNLVSHTKPSVIIYNDELEVVCKLFANCLFVQEIIKHRRYTRNKSPAQRDSSSIVATLLC